MNYVANIDQILVPKWWNMSFWSMLNVIRVLLTTPTTFSQSQDVDVIIFNKAPVLLADTKLHTSLPYKFRADCSREIEENRSSRHAHYQFLSIGWARKRESRFPIAARVNCKKDGGDLG